MAMHLVALRLCLAADETEALVGGELKPTDWLWFERLCFAVALERTALGAADAELYWAAERLLCMDT